MATTSDEETGTDIEQVQGVLAEQAAEAKRLADAQAAVDAQQWALERERQKAREEAERNAAEEQDPGIAQIVGFVMAADASLRGTEETSAAATPEKYHPGAFELGPVWGHKPQTAEAVPANPSDPMAVWDDLKAVWESLDIEDADAVEEWATCVLNEGEQQAKRLTDALADRVA